MKKWGAWSCLVIVLVIVGLFAFRQDKDSYHGIHITFEDNTPAEYIEDMIERYNPDETYHNYPRDVREVRMDFFHKSKRQVKKLASQIMDEEYVIVAYHVVVVNPSAFD